MFGGKDDWANYTLLYFNDNESKYVNSEEKNDQSRICLAQRGV
jgi:hypothetical protein